MPLWIRYDGLKAGGQRGSDVIINAAPPVSTDVRFDRTDRLGRDGQVAGRDLISKRVWDFTLYTNQRTEDEAVSFAQAWERAWHDPEIRSGRRQVPLEYSRDNQTWYRVFGRPTLFTGPELNVLTRQGAGRIDLQFEQLDPWHYSEQDAVTTLRVAPGARGGLRAPIRVPVQVARSGGNRDHWVRNDGENPAPVTLRFNGPLSDPVVTLQNHWRFALSGRLEWDEYLVVDSRARSIEVRSTHRPTVRSAFSWIRKGSRFSDLHVPPGEHVMSFQALDPTYTASLDVSWPHTYQSMQ